MSTPSQQHHHIDPGQNNWLVELIDSFEAVARTGSGVSCDPRLALAVSKHLARKDSQKHAGDRRSLPESSLV